MLNCYWIENTATTLVKLRKASRGVAVIPLASIESHGPHLPLGSDPLVADHVVKRVVARETVAVLPTLPYSYVGEARACYGAIHMGSDLVQQMVEQICDEIYRNGFDKIVLLHMHGGNISLHWQFTKRILEAEKPYAVYSLPVLLSDVEERWRPLLESKEWGHACELETSLNLAACPGLVRLDLLGKKTFKAHAIPRCGQASTPVDYIAKWPQMAIGRPQLATPEKGEAAAAAWTDTIVKHLKLVKKDKVVPRAMKDYARRANSYRGRGKGK